MVRAIFLLPALFFCGLTSQAMAADASAEDLAPPDTIFFMKVQDVTTFYTEFLSDHVLSLSNPIVAQTIKNGAEKSVMNVPPAPLQVPLALEASELLYTAVASQLFVACVADESGKAGFIAGGKSPAPVESIAKLRAAISAKVPGEWSQAKIGESPSQALAIPGIGAVTLCSSGDWVLIGTSLPGMEHALGAIAKPGAGLSSTELWKTNMAQNPAEVSLQYFSRLDAFADLAEKQGASPVTNLFRNRLQGLRAFSWSYATKGRGSVALDFFSITFTPEVAAQLKAIALPLGQEWRKLLSPNTVAIVAYKLDYDKLVSAPFLEGMPIQQLLTKPEVKRLAAMVIDQLPETFESRSTLLEAGAKLVSDPISSVLLDATDSLPAAENVFIDLRMDRATIAAHFASRLKTNYAKWQPLLTQRGVALPPGPAPEIELEEFLGPLRSTFGISGENLVLINSFQLGPKTGSTLMTSSSLVTQVAFHDEITKFRLMLDGWFKPEPKQSAQEEADLFHVCFWTNYFCGPMLPPNQNSIFSDLVSQFFLATPPEL